MLLSDIEKDSDFDETAIEETIRQLTLNKKFLFVKDLGFYAKQTSNTIQRAKEVAMVVIERMLERTDEDDRPAINFTELWSEINMHILSENRPHAFQFDKEEIMLLLRGTDWYVHKSTAYRELPAHQPHDSDDDDDDDDGIAVTFFVSHDC